MAGETIVADSLYGASATWSGNGHEAGMAAVDELLEASRRQLVAGETALAVSTVVRVQGSDTVRTVSSNRGERRRTGFSIPQELGRVSIRRPIGHRYN